MTVRATMSTLLAVLSLASAARAEPPNETVEDILCRGSSAVGFSYAWGGECWCASACSPDLVSCSAGSCSGSCPSCTHTGTYGADCSGFVSRAWQVPGPLAVDACDTDRYVAASFTSDHDYWDPVSMDSLRPGDAAATSSHVVLIVGERNAEGYDVIEARGCSYGIVHRRRGLSGYVGARRINLVDCSCEAGDVETRECGDCGQQERGCDDGCNWSSWSECEGPDPSGAEAECTVEDAVGPCAEGRRRCVAGWLTCEPGAASEEVCDGLDNDCDGVEDNGTPESLGEGGACTHECGAGELQCFEGELQCVTPGRFPGDPCDEPPTGDGGADDSGPGPDAGDDDADTGPEGPPPSDGVSPVMVGLRGGCACRVGAGRPEGSVALVLLLGAVLALRRRAM